MKVHQVELEEELEEVRTETDSLKSIQQPRGSHADRRGCFKCLVASVAMMGLVIVTLVLGFILFHFMLTPLSKQDAAPPRDTGKLNIAFKLKESDEQGRYDIFTAGKGGRYLIYGSVNLRDITIGDKVILRTTIENDSRTIKSKQSNTTVSFCEEVLLTNNTTISIYFSAFCTDSSFHVFEL